MPAQFHVNTTLDTPDANPGDGVALDASGMTSLRAAVMEANALVGGDTIFLPAGTYTLTIAGAGEDGARTGDLDVTDTTGVLEIQGPVPSGAATINGNGIDRVFDIHPGGYVYAYYVTVTGGSADYGGGFRNAGHLFLATKSVVAGNAATVRGGGVDSSQATSRLTVSGSTFDGNSAGDITSASSGGIGGAVAASAAVAINDTVFRDNTAGGNGSGGAVQIRGAGTLDRNTYLGNRAGSGGAIDSVGAGVSVNDSTFDGNVATRSTVTGGPVPLGGAVRNQGTIRIAGSTFVRNDAAGAGGTGGALANLGGSTMTIVNSTISGNFAGTNTNSQSSGGGVSNLGTLTLVHATIVQNVVRFSGPGGGVSTPSTSALTTIRNTIIALNGQGASNAPDVTGAFASQGGNLIGRGVGSGGWVATDQVGNASTGPINPLIGPLQNNGGYTPTHALLPGSTAIDRGVANFSPENAPRDQRGQNRPAGPANDIGAFEVQGTNRPPTANADEYVVNEDTPLTAAAGVGVLANDSDLDGNPLTAALAAGPANGTLALNADGSFAYTPAANFSGTDSFTYTVSDGNGGSAIGTVTILVQAVNDPPVAADDAYSTNEDTTLRVLAPGILANDSDPDGPSLTIQIVDRPTHGVLDPAGGGAFVYVPAANFSGTDSFTYRLSDGTAASGLATVTITVVAVNDAPVVQDVTAEVGEDGPAVSGTFWGTDVDGPLPLAFDVMSPPALGTVVNNGDGTFRFDPGAAFQSLRAGEQRAVTFTYRATDGAGLAGNTATVTVTVTGANDAPTAVADAGTTTEDTPLVVAAPGLLGNDTDPDVGDTKRVVSVNGTPSAVGQAAALPSGAVLTVRADGSYRYDPSGAFESLRPGQSASDSFTYVLADALGLISTAIVTVTVTGVNDAPTLAGATFALPENSPNGTTVGTVAGADAEGNALTYRIVGGNTLGAFAVDAATGRITVANTSALDYETRTTFTLKVEVRDAGGLTATAAVVVNLTDVPEAPRVAIDILPGQSDNRIKAKSKGKIEVAILSTSDFDARTVDVASLRFGRTGQEQSLSVHPKQGPRFHYEDVNGDGRLDLVVEFETELTGFRAGDTRGILTGKLLNGTAFSAEDDVTIV